MSSYYKLKTLVFICVYILSFNIKAQDSSKKLFIGEIELELKTKNNKKNENFIFNKKNNYKITVFRKKNKENPNIFLDQTILKNTKKKINFIYKKTISFEPAVEQNKKHSHLIDFNTETFQAYIDKLKLKIGHKPSPQVLNEIANKHIKNKSLARGFDGASKILELKEGDCTEHAVFLTALFRAFNYPARVSIGAVILLTKNTTSKAFYHAWAEYFDTKKNQWFRSDAALNILSSQTLYLKLGHLNNEGYSFRLNLFKIWKNVNISKFIVQEI